VLKRQRTGQRGGAQKLAAALPSRPSPRPVLLWRGPLGSIFCYPFLPPLWRTAWAHKGVMQHPRGILAQKPFFRPDPIRPRLPPNEPLLTLVFYLDATSAVFSHHGRFPQAVKSLSTTVTLPIFVPAPAGSWSVTGGRNITRKTVSLPNFRLRAGS
jgi:hypothetical protein